MKRFKLDANQKKVAKKTTLRCSIIMQACFLLGMFLNVENNSWITYAIFFAVSFAIMMLSLEDDYK